MSPFTSEYIDFLTELAFNNEKPWFDKNRKRYEDHVREPFKAFTVDIIAEVQKFDKSIGPLEPKDVMFRINRDIRFAKDKTPYNTWLSAAIMPGGKRSKESRPGYYFRFAVDKVQLGGGTYHPDRQQLHAIRSKIAKDPKALHKIIDSKRFKDVWGEVKGEENKVLPKEFKQAAENEPLLKRKTFNYWLDAPEQEILRPDLMEWIIQHFKAGKTLNDYLQ